MTTAPPPISSTTPDVQTPRVRVPTYKGVQPQQIALRTQARKSATAIAAMPTSALNPPLDSPVAQQTYSHTLSANIVSHQKCAICIYSKALLDLWVMPVLVKATGKLLNYWHLWNPPTLANTWNTLFSNKIVRLFQVVVEGSDEKHNRVDGTNTFHVICYKDIPLDRCKKITFTSIVYEFRPHKEDPNRMRITIMGNWICYTGDTGINTDSLVLGKLVINSVISRSGTKIAWLDVANFYLVTPLDHPKYVKIKLADIPLELID